MFGKFVDHAGDFEKFSVDLMLEEWEDDLVALAEVDALRISHHITQK